MPNSWYLLTFFVAVHPCQLISTKGNDFSVLLLNWIYKTTKPLQLGTKEKTDYKILLTSVRFNDSISSVSVNFVRGCFSVTS